MKSTMMRMILAIALDSVVFGSALAGDLEPSGPPAPTMVTLQEIYDLLQGSTGCSATLAKTGQTGCWNASGTPIGCAGTGQDAEYQYGASVSPRFTDNGDGTVKDNLTGLVWLRNANCFGQQNWTNALSSANALAAGSCGLTDGSVARDWRLPNFRELESLMDYQNAVPALPIGHPFTGVQLIFYWSSTTRAFEPDNAWGVNMSSGFGHDSKNAVWYVWPVRGQ